MRSRWEALHAGLMRSIENEQAVWEFEELRVRAAVLRRFGQPAAVVSYLAHEGGDLDDKDAILAALVEAVADGLARRLAHALLVLGLWPGLDTAFTRRLRLFQDQPHDFGAQLVDRFTAHVRRIDTRRVTRVAATLVRNTERDVVRARRRELAVAARSTEVWPDVASVSQPEAAVSPFGLRRDQSECDDVTALRGWLQRAVGQDADLVVNAVIHGRDRRELARELGISHAAARKRLQRALERARGVVDSDCRSHGGDTLAFGD